MYRNAAIIGKWDWQSRQSGAISAQPPGILRAAAHAWGERLFVGPFGAGAEIVAAQRFRNGDARNY
jgi:hypothetical protein